MQWGDAENQGAAVAGRLAAIPCLPDFHARYPKIVLGIGFAGQMIDWVHAGGDYVVRNGGPDDSTFIARSLPACLAVNNGESCVAGLGIV